MDKGIYTALSGGMAKSHELELVANNLANANTPGFKGDVGTFNEYLMELRRPDTAEGTAREIQALTNEDARPQGDKSFVEMDGVYTNFAQGNLERTGRKLDVGLHGNGFFEVLTPQGVRYTRQGNFDVANDGTLVTVNGYPILAKVQNTPNVDHAVKVDATGKVVGEVLTRGEAESQNRIIKVKSGNVEITPQGTIYENNRPIGTISVTEFKEPQWLEKVGNSYYRNDHPENALDTSKTEMQQGFIEGSNVNPVKEMTKLIEVTRSYESHMQAIKTYQEIDNRTSNDIAKER